MIPIIITTVNGREEYLRRTLASIRATVPGASVQTLPGKGSAVENFRQSVILAFGRCRDDAIIVCEDDVLFCAGWYEALTVEAERTGADVLSAMSFGEAEPIESIPFGVDEFASYPSDGCPCCCLLIRRDWWESWHALVPDYPIGKSNWLRNGIVETKGHMRILSPHYAQHVGIESTGPLDHRLANRVSLSLAGPLVEGEEVAASLEG